MSTATHSISSSTTTHRVAHGVVGGLAGGLVFGLLMQMMGMIPMIAQLVGSNSPAVGWIVHLAISSVIGATFAVLFARLARTVAGGALYGMGYGILWWVLGGLILLPARLGMPVFELNTTAWQSLMGHLLYGLLLGAVFSRLSRRDHG